MHLGPHNLARVERGESLERVAEVGLVEDRNQALAAERAAQVENEALKMSAQETTAALQETTAELRDLKGELKWLQRAHQARA